MRVVYFLLFICCYATTNAQFTVTNSNNAAALAQRIVGNGVTILNPIFKGAAISAGFFKDLTGTVGIDSGIVLTSGRAASVGGVGVTGTASQNASTNNNSPSDNDLNGLVTGNPASNKDACVLEFDFIPQGDSINVRFVFGSEEYPTYACSNFNDVFAFLVSGPGIVGNKNIALVPGTNIPVAINSINGGSGTSGNIANCTALGPGSPFTNLFVNNSGNQFATYNGFTRVLVAQLLVTPCQTYHIKLAIQDVGDGTLDSGVFLQASSFSSNAVTASNVGGVLDNQNNTNVVEGCKSSKIKFLLGSPATSPTTLPITYSGTATYGVDYAALPSSILFAVGEIEKTLDVFPLLDTIAEVTETIIVSIAGGSACSNAVSSTVTVYIKDSISFYNIRDTFVCSKFPTLLTAKFNDTTTNKYLWSNGDTTRQSNVFTPGNSYWVVHTFANRCFNIDTFRVADGDPMLSIGNNNISFCNTDSALVTATATPTGGNYLWNTGETTSSAYVKNTGVYTVKYTATNGCFVTKSLQTVAKPLPYANLGRDTSLCTYENIVLNAFYPNATYLWSTGETTSSINVKDSALYTVATTLNGCSVRDTILVGRKITPIVDAGADATILAGGTVKLKALQDIKNASYLWYPSMYIDRPTVYNPFASPPVTANIYLKVTSVDNCVAVDTLLITVKDFLLDIPNAFSPNGDGINDTWVINLLSSYIYSKIQVYDRNGQLVYNNTGYEKAWDGYSNGKPLPVGTYYYIIEPGFGRQVRSGWVAIIK